jgi:hypothetical protein
MEKKKRETAKGLMRDADKHFQEGDYAKALVCYYLK